MINTKINKVNTHNSTGTKTVNTKDKGASYTKSTNHSPIKNPLINRYIATPEVEVKLNPSQQCLADYFNFSIEEVSNFSKLDIEPGYLLQMLQFTRSKKDIKVLLNKCLKNPKGAHKFFNALMDHPISNWNGVQYIQLNTIVKLFDLGILEHRIELQGERGLVKVWPLFFYDISYFEKFTTKSEIANNFPILKEQLQKKAVNVKELTEAICTKTLHTLIPKK
ncbi:MAG: hypothetical protein COZ46_07640 [Verrucomicrobia bacterium CG_4_10_14_3_um_filter_43_23]|nr:MAG: hypothetical protein AUJ82_03285 [Verrucomicrobia bacterium CG1_02_43_26]PIP59719.1 MAG: hypothetical protein COX01_02115 [Verrucomicrobia bacterium CG22_combo_CG10-13_8_21_14_all_43_17]PIX57731.1 MAG: hypothetical protein COZ46_07640 [Verrucomicrobia bacterium CG_4_10_14_3_um_filter_43_23]PIY62523.1 MAG: hypothetical protein COY94_01825 [Verrucomicrobia bacterium CG_4_10_14_0_8_um_filter_43_34]PJA44657.1 MAG: hypothetical protein CO175_01800 [Verrucomicrobia bacterium CG_4_9_14_3_um_fi